MQLDALKTAIFSCQGVRRDQKFKIDAFFFGLAYFDLFRRHIFFGPAIEDCNFFRSQPHSCTGCVHRGIAATDDCNFFAQPLGVSDTEVIKKIYAAIDTGKIFSFNAERDTLPHADSDINRIKSFPQIIKRKVAADFGVGYKCCTQVRNQLSFLKNNVVR